MFPSQETIKSYSPGFVKQNNSVRAAIKVIKCDGKIRVYNARGETVVTSSFIESINVEEKLALFIFEEILQFPNYFQQMPRSLVDYIRMKIGGSNEQIIKEEEMEVPLNEVDNTPVINYNATTSQSVEVKHKMFKFPSVKARKSQKFMKPKNLSEKKKPNERRNMKGHARLCDHCSFQTDSITLLNQHFLDAHKKGRAIICSCGFYIGSKRHLIRHKQFSLKYQNNIQAVVDELKLNGVLPANYSFDHENYAEIDAGTEDIGNWIRRDISSYINYMRSYFQILWKNHQYVLHNKN